MPKTTLHFVGFPAGAPVVFVSETTPNGSVTLPLSDFSSATTRCSPRARKRSGQPFGEWNDLQVQASRQPSSRAAWTIEALEFLFGHLHHADASAPQNESHSSDPATVIAY